MALKTGKIDPGSMSLVRISHARWADRLGPPVIGVKAINSIWMSRRDCHTGRGLKDFKSTSPPVPLRAPEIAKPGGA
jgi:hypothetical protein